MIWGVFFWTPVNASIFYDPTLAKGPKKNPPNFGGFFFGPLDKKVTPFGVFFMDHPVDSRGLPIITHESLSHPSFDSRHTETRTNLAKKNMFV